MNRTRELLILGVILLAFTVAVIRQIGVDAGFEYDESVYAVQARAWVSDAPSTGVALHRAPLLPILGMPVAAVADGEEPFRVLGLVLVLFSIVAVWWLGRSIGSPGAGLIAAVVFASSQHVLLRAGQFLTDIPAAGAMIAAMALWWVQLERRDRPGPTVFAVPVLLAVAFYFRYGSALPIALIVITATVLWWRPIRANARLMVRAAGLLALLLVPHMITAIARTGTPWGIVTYTGTVAAQTRVGEGLSDYLDWFPQPLAGRAAGWAMAAGLLATVSAVALRRRDDSRAAVFLAVPALVNAVLLGIFIHAEPRFLFLPVALLVVAGSVAGVRVVATLSGAPAALLAAGLAVAIAAPVPLQARVAYNRTEHLREERTVVLAVSRAIAAAVPEGEPCSALAMAVPSITWYTGCETLTFGEPEAPGREQLLKGEHRFIVLFHGDQVTPAPRLAARYRGIRGLTLVQAADRRDLLGEVRFTGYEIYRLPRGLPG